jgi:hypothetical protein
MPSYAPARALAAFCFALSCASAAAAPPSPAVRTEIDALLDRLKSSGCQFERNRSWYGGEQAQAHLARKLRYIVGRKEGLTSTEQFIELAASASSMTGKPYRVRCGGAEPVRSRDWLLGELARIRGKKP